MLLIRSVLLFMFVLLGLHAEVARADADLVAHYRLDDSWDVSHTALNSIAGGTVATVQNPYASRILTPGVAPNKPNTCFGAAFTASTGALQGSSSGLDLTVGGISSVSFWMYWNGGDNQMPFGFNRYDLWLNSGSFGFNTANGDIYGIASSSLANGWHHVAAVFVNGNVSGNKLWIDGVQQTLTQRLAPPNNAVAYVSTSFQASGWGQNNSFRFDGRIDELKVYAGQITEAEVLANYTDICVVADWHMDEANWNGTVGEVKDSGGGGFHGTARIANGSTSVPTTAKLTPAKSSGGESTCAYGEFDVTTAPARTYSYVELSNFPALPSSFTFAAWIRSTNAGAQHQRILVRDDADNGWGLSLADGTGQPELRFFNRNVTNTGVVVGDGVNPNCGVFCLDTNRVLTNNAWYYIAAAIDTAGKSVTLYVFDVAGVLKAKTSTTFAGTWKDGTGKVTIGGESSASSEGRQTSFHFLGNIDELRIFSGVLSQPDIQAMLSRTRTCAAPPPPPPVNFNCVESGANESSGHLYTKLVGLPFTFDVVALKANGTVDTEYALAASKTLTVELVDGAGTTACAARTPINPAVSQSLFFSKTSQPVDQGRKQTNEFTVSKAYADLRCRVTDANQSPSIVGCSTDDFTVRPTGLVVTSGASADLSGASATATPAAKTGSSFSLVASSGVAGYSAIPKVDTSKAAAHAGALQIGTLAGSFGNADPVTGAAAGAFSYSEVGYFNIGSQGVYDDTWAAIDAVAGDCTADFSNALVAGKVGCKFGNGSTTNYFGRFYPDHFAINDILFTPACVSGSFSYMDQPFALSATVDALNAGGAITRNYAGAFAKAAVTIHMENANSGVPIPAARLSIVGSPTWAAGRYPLTATKFSRGAGPDGPYDLLDIGLALADEAALPSAARPQLIVRNMDAASVSCVDDHTGLSTAASVCSATRIVNAARLRFGRLRLDNAHGSQLLPLAIPYRAEYWNGTTFVQNTADSCTVVSANNIGFAQYLGNLNAGNLGVASLTVTPLVAGAGSIRLGKPTPAAFGSVDVLLNLGSAGSPSNCPGLPSAGSTPAVLPYLSGQWCGSAHDRDPTARATFGVYKSPLILRRENY